MSELIDREAVREFIKSYRHSTDVAFDMEKHLDEIPTASPWHRVEEELPEKNGAYLVFIGYGDNWIWFKDIYKDGKFMADTCALNGARVTHWMPIEPPKEDA